MVIELQLTKIPPIRRIEKSAGLPLPGLIDALKILRRYRLLHLDGPDAGERWDRWLDSYNARCAEIVKDRGDVTTSRYRLKSAENAGRSKRAEEKLKPTHSLAGLPHAKLNHADGGIPFGTAK
jgi:hypothetical protein